MVNKTVDINMLMSANLYNEHGYLIPMPSLWKSGPALIVFLRQFGCISCRAHATEIWNQRRQFEERGAKLYFVGNGSARFINKFKEDLKMQSATVFTDPSLRSFQAAGLKRGVVAALGPASMRNTLTMIKNGHRQGVTAEGSGDLWQLGGLLLVSASGQIKYHYVSQSTGDFPEIETIGSVRRQETSQDWSMR